MKRQVVFPPHLEQFSFVNRFGPTRLKERIWMMNRTATMRSWLVYLVLLGVTTFVTTLAAVKQRPEQLLLRPALAIPQPTQEPTAPLITKLTLKPLMEPALPSNVVAEPVIELMVKKDSAATQVTALSIVVPENSSRYIIRQNNTIYWVITPKMSFSELIEVKKEIEQYDTNHFDFNAIQFDPLQQYIQYIGVKIFDASGSAETTSGDKEKAAPIESIWGYVSTSSRGVGSVSSSSDTPDALKAVAREDEQSIQQLIAEKRMEYLIAATKVPGFGSSRTLPGQFLRNKSGRSNERFGAYVTPEGGIELYEPTKVTVWINGKDASPDALRAIRAEKLHTVVVSNRNNEATGVEKRYVLIFVNP